MTIWQIISAFCANLANPSCMLYDLGEISLYFKFPIWIGHKMANFAFAINSRTILRKCLEYSANVCYTCRKCIYLDMEGSIAKLNSSLQK